VRWGNPSGKELLMAFDGRQDPYKALDAKAVQKRIRANKRGLSYEVDNRLRQEEIRERVCYQNGMTLTPRARKMFMQTLCADLALRSNSGHAKLLRQNMVDAGVPVPKAKPAGHASAHHIVASLDEEAADSRMLLFGWGIGINDADNGVFLPRTKSSSIPQNPKATKHAGVHTGIYHHQVFIRLDAAADMNAKDQKIGRSALRKIKGELLQGTFPFQEEHLV
jgi:hypothetical protein